MGQCMRWGGMQRAVGEGQEDAGCWVRYAMLPAEQARFRSGKTAVEAMRFADVHREQKDADGGGNRQTVCVCTRRGQAGRIAYLLLFWQACHVRAVPENPSMALLRTCMCLALRFGRQRASARLIAAICASTRRAIAVPLPHRGQRDRQPRRVSQFIIHERARMFGRREATTLAYHHRRAAMRLLASSSNHRPGLHGKRER